MLRVGIYARVSTDEQVGPEGSITNQIQRCETYLDLHFGSSSEKEYMVRARYEEEGKSGKDIQNRPQFQQMIADIRNGTINAICVAELSRLSRSVKDIANILSDFEKQETVFLCLNPSVDTSTASGKLVLNVMAALAEYEREQTAARTKAAMYDRAQRGLWGGSRIFGFDLHPEKKGHLVVNQEEAEVVREIFETYLREKSIARTVEEINSRGHRIPGYTSRRGKKHPEREFSYSTIQTMLHNRAYVGEKEINKKNKGKSPEEIEADEQYEIVEAVWPAIVEEKLFKQVQITLAQNTQTRSRANRDHVFLMSDLVQCEHCNVGLENGSGTGRGGKRYYYRHTTGTQRDDCPIGSLPAPKLEETIVERLQEIAEDEGLIERACERANEGRVDRIAELKTELEELEDQKQAEEAELDLVIDGIAKTGEVDGPVRKAIDSRSETIEELEGLIEQRWDERRALQKTKADPKRMKL